MLDLNASGLESKIKSSVTSVTDAFKKLEKGGFDWNKLMSGSFDDINWTSLVSKLFSPANLVAFFSAMAATGIIASLESLQAGATAATSAGLTTGAGGASAGAAISSGALDVQNTLGGLAGSTTDVASALAEMTAYVEQFGGSASDAQTIVTELGQALTATGGTLSTGFGPILQLIQNSGATTAAQIETLISNVMSASQASGGQLSMADVASQTSDFAVAAQKAGVSFQGINTAIVTFGAEAKVNLSGAQADMTLLTSEVNGSTDGMTALADQGQTFNGLISSLNTNASTTFSDMNTALAKMPAPIAATLASALGIPLPAEQAATSLAKWGPSISAAVAQLVVMNGPTALGNVSTQFQDSLSALDQMKIDVQNIVDTLAGASSPFIKDFLLPTLQAFEYVIQHISVLTNLFDSTISSQASGLASGLAGVGSAISNSGILPNVPGTNGNAIQDIQNAIVSWLTGSSSSNSSATVKVAVTATPGSSASVSTQSNNLVSGGQSNGTTPSSSNVTVTSK